MNSCLSRLLKAALSGLLILSCIPPALAQSLLTPNFNRISATQLSNTNGQWVTISPQQPDNIDLVETRIFKMPERGSGILGVEFKLIGADGGTARFKTLVDDRLAHGGQGGEITFTIDLSQHNLTWFPPPSDGFYGRPFIVTFGKKGESVTHDKARFMAAGGGGSTGMSWLVPRVHTSKLFRKDGWFIAGAGGGSGGFYHYTREVHGHPANGEAHLLPDNHELCCISEGHNYNFPLSSAHNVTLFSGGSRLRTYEMGDTLNRPVKPGEEYLTVSGVYHNVYEYISILSLQSITLGQQGGRPYAVKPAREQSGPLLPGQTFGGGAPALIARHGGRGGSGFAGGGAGVSTPELYTSIFEFPPLNLPTSGAGGTGSPAWVATANKNMVAGAGGWNDYYFYGGSNPYQKGPQNVSLATRGTTNNPQSGRFMYRTINDTTPPEINISSMTVYLGSGNTGSLAYQPNVSFEDAIQPYLMREDGIWDNDGIASVTADVSHFECFMARPEIGPVPVNITVTDAAGNVTQGLIMVTVVDPFVPVPTAEYSPDFWDPDLPWRIDVNSGPVTLTAANFPPAFDGCKPSASVRVHFQPTTFTCADVGNRTVEYYYTDTDGNQSKAYFKTFKVVYSAPERLYVDASATGNNTGKSWADAFTDLQDAFTYGCISGDIREIYVAQGTYKTAKGNSSDREATFRLVGKDRLYGGFPSGGADFADRNPDAYPTILSGDIGQPGIATDNSYNVVTITGDRGNEVWLEGFTIRDGYADGSVRYGGGGLLMDYAGTTISRIHTTIRNCKFINNHARLGGAIYTYHYDLVLYYYLRVHNTLFEGNTASEYGGAVYLKNENSTSNVLQEFVNCVFNSNSAGFGGAICTPLRTEGTVNIVNSTLVNNMATSGAAVYNQSNVKLRNSIVYFNVGGNQLRNAGGISFEIDHSNIQGSGGSTGWAVWGIADHGNNIDADPLFAASPAWSLSPQSPCLNTGLNSHNTEPFDISGKERISQGTIDMGAFEVNPVVYVAADAGPGGDGESWATAFNNLNEGIKAAGTGANQKDVWVKAGTYRPDRLPGSNTVTANNRENSFYVSFALKIYGGFSGNETSTAQRNIGQNPTILSGDIGIVNNASDNAYHVVTMMAGDARLDGLIIEGGNANDAGNGDNRNGGGIYERVLLGSGKNSIANCVFRNNQAQEAGGAWFAAVGQPSTTDFVQTLFYNNTASRGAVSYIVMNHPNASSYDQNFYNVSVSGNTASASGAAFEANELTGRPARFNFYNSVLAGNAPQNYSPANSTLNHTFATALGTDVFTNPSNPAGTDGKIMTTDDGLQLNMSSPAINFGDNALLYSGTDRDIAGNTRIVNKVDAGAYESRYHAPLTVDPNAIIYVRPTAAGEGTGRDWDNATGDLHNAIHALGVQKVFVAVGIYKVGDHSFIMKNGVEIYGGFDPDNGIRDLMQNRLMPDPSDNTVKSSVLDGQFTRPVIWNIFTEGTALNGSAVLDGFMLAHGKHATGAGVRNIYASPTLRNLVIANNRATLLGGGVYNEHSSPEMTNVLICNNGIDSFFEPNGEQDIRGGGMYNTASSAPVLVNVTLSANYLRTPIDNTTMGGAGMYNKNSSPTVRNSIIWGNRKGYDVTMEGVDFEHEGSGLLKIQNSITQGHDTGNEAHHNLVNIDPQFENTAALNFRLSAVSPAIDAGSNTLYSGLDSDTKDLAGKARVYDFAAGKPIDMGAYEYQCARVNYNGMTFENKTVAYDGTPHQVVVQNLPQEVSVAYEMRDPDWEIVPDNIAVNAGIYTVTATMTPTGAMGDCTPYVRTVTLTIQKAPSVISTEDVQRFVYDGTVKNITASLNHTEATLAYSDQQGYTGVGVYTILVSVPATANYLAASEMVNLVIENRDFTGITLEDKAFAFDATPKSLMITGPLPEGTTVVFGGNGRTRPGVYTVNALIQNENYNDLWLEATMTIEGVDIVPGTNGTVYVKPVSTGTKDGSSWENATADLQGAIDVATQVLVAVGNYDVPTPHSFVMKDGVAIYGGFNPVDNMTNWETRTLLNEGTEDGSLLNGKNESPLIWNYNNGLDAAALLDGFTLMNGKGSLAGAILNYQAAPSLNNLVIRNNTAIIGGGGIYNDSAPITLTNSIIKDNTAEYGGGIRNNNSASRLTNVIITGNSATMSTEGAGGGGIFNQASALELTNVLIAGNSTNFQGGGFRNLSGNPVFTNVTMANNTAVNDAATTAMDIAGGVPQLHNTIVFGTIGGNYATQSSMIDDNTSNARGAAAHAITDVFTSPDNGDYTLRSGSPAINAGNNNLYLNLDANTRDLAGNLRLVGPHIDMGAYENPDGALPVRWVSFESRMNDQRQAVLNWKTEEYNVSHYEVQRSANGRDFRIAGKVKAGGTGSGNYSLTDPAPVYGTVYYRIRQVDTDGSFSYSRMISLASGADRELVAWPNPARDRVTIDLGSGYIGSTASLISTAGIALQQVEVKNEILILDVSRYAPGIYLLQMYDGKVLKLIRE